MTNLIINAGQATEGKDGQLLIVVANTFTDTLAGQSTNVIVEVIDNGEGIPHEYQARIFEPFFTTKQDGNGLGLSAARRLANAHNGDLIVDSVVGKGTRMTMTLPVSESLPHAYADKLTA